MFSSIDRYIMGFYRAILRAKEAFLLKRLKNVAERGLIADLVSFSGLVSGILAAIYMHYSRGLFVIFWIGKRLADILDGPIYRLNKRRIIRGINFDAFCDILFSLILMLSAIPIVGLFWPLITAITFAIHVRFDSSGMGGRSFFAPSNWGQYLFLFGLFKEGLIIQTVFTVCAFLIRRVMGKGEDKVTL